MAVVVQNDQIIIHTRKHQLGWWKSYGHVLAISSPRTYRRDTAVDSILGAVSFDNDSYKLITESA